MTAVAPGAAPRREAGTDPRHAAVWRVLADVLAAAGPASDGLMVVDAGGGSGGFAVPLAARGHRVTVVDPSQDALAALTHRAAAAGVAGRVTGRQGDLSELVSIIGQQQADLLLCHAVLEQVDDPRSALATALRVLRPGGWLSLLVAGRAGAVLARVVAGRFDEAAQVLAHQPAGSGSGPPADPPRRFDTPEVVSLVRAAGAEVVAVHGVRVFADLAAAPPVVGDGDGDRELAAAGGVALPAAWADRLADLEEAVSARPPYRDLAAQLHVLARRPLSGGPGATPAGEPGRAP